MKVVNREDVWKTKEVPVVLIDTRVFLHLFCRQLEGADAHSLELMMLAKWANLLNNPLPWLKHQPPGWKVALIDDYKDSRGKYWRYDLYPEYKGNRGAEPGQGTLYRLGYDALLKYLEKSGSDVPMFRELGFEADDFAGSFARLKRKGEFNSPLIIYTCDYDHQQLISDKHDIQWANAFPYRPRLRSEFEMVSVHASRNIIFSEPVDIVDYKQEYGDEGDNIFPGAPREIIDLIDPPLKPDPSPLQEWLKTCKPNTNPSHYRSAIQTLIQAGLAG